MARLSADRRRRDLTAAAVALLVDDGPGSLTTRRVAERAGASLGTVHYVFRGKEELLAAAANELLEAFAGALRAEASPELGIRAGLDAVLASYWRWLRANEPWALAFVEAFVAMLRAGHARRPLDDAHALVLSLLRDAALHDPQPPETPMEDLTQLALVAVDGLTLVHLATRDAKQTERHLELLMRALRALP